jgi:cell division protein FtsW
MHMAVSLGLMPTTGLTLPFMSYGRSSQVISLLGTGILINIGRLRGKPRGIVNPRGEGGSQPEPVRFAQGKRREGGLARRMPPSLHSG